MLPVPMFPLWRPIWDAELGHATHRLDELAAERQRRRASAPVVTPEIMRCVAAERVQALIHGAPTLPTAEAFAALQELRPLLEAAVWPRWLLLEEALEEAAASGSLHLAALVLRTQVEELDALQDVARLLELTLESVEDSQLFANSIAVLATRVLPRLRAKSAKELLEPAGEAPGAVRRSERLQKTFDELGDYVHPNYGNYVLLVRPHSNEAASIIIESFVAVYEAFLALPWVDDTGRTSEAATRREERPFKLLADVTAPELARACGGDVGAPPWSDAIATFNHQAHLEELLNADVEAAEGGDTKGEGVQFDVEAIRALRTRGLPPESWPIPISNAGERLRYIHLVADERRLVADVTRLGATPGERNDATAWLQMMCSALTFTINIIEFKLDTLGRQAARLINIKNIIGATLVVRSMLEHHAVSLELSKKLGALWEQIERTALNEQRVAAILSEAERQVARVLASSPESREQSAAWRTLWEGSVRRYHVLDPVTAVDKDQPGYLKTYGLLSHIVHGTIWTGGDLLGDGRAAHVRGHLAQLALFLATVCEPESMLDRQAKSMIVAQRLAMTALDPADGLGPRVVNMRLIDGQKLKPGRDVRGSGAEDDPFHFRRGLLYHDAYDHWLKQHGIQVRERRLHKFAHGIGDRVETEDGRVLFFLNDTLTSMIVGERDETTE